MSKPGSKPGLSQLKADVVNSIRTKMKENGITESFYNKITGGTGACESVNTAFTLANTLDLSFLSQTDQLLMEAEILENDLHGVWTLGRSYRNEPRTGDGRHLSEFALLEFEQKDMDLKGLVSFQQELLDAAMKVALESPCVSTEHKKRLEQYLKKPAPVISYTEIIERLSNKGVSFTWGNDFSSTTEEMVCLLYDGPVQITHYPESIKFFNMYRSNRGDMAANMSINEYNEKRYTVECCDFLLPWAGETFGASRREENYHTLTTKLKESSMFAQMVRMRADWKNWSHNDPVPEEIKEDAWKPFVSYLELFNPEKHSDRQSFTRSGFGLGMGRLLQFLLGNTEVIVF